MERCDAQISQRGLCGEKGVEDTPRKRREEGEDRTVDPQVQVHEALALLRPQLLLQPLVRHSPECVRDCQ